MNEQILCSKCEDEAQNVCNKCGDELLWKPCSEEDRIKYLQIKNTEDTLPETLYELLEVALYDLGTISEKEEYKINMLACGGHYGRSELSWGGPGKCEVSLAGSVMARLVDYDSKAFLNHDYFQDSIDRKLVTIEELRTLDLDGAFCHLDIDNKKRRNLDEVFRIRDELKYLEAWFKTPGYEKLMWFSNFKESIRFYSKIQTKLEALGV